MKIGIVIAVVALAAALGGCGDETRFATIGTGSMGGVYYPTGGFIAKLVNEKSDEYGIRLTFESTQGSVFNVNAIVAGDAEFGIVQSDRQYQAVNGLAEWKDQGPQTLLRSVFSIHQESVALVAADDAGIRTLADLRGKRVNIGNPGSGQRQNSIDALTAAGIDWEKDLNAEQVKASDAPGLLQDERIDAFFYTVGHPSGSLKEATAGVRKVRFLDIPGVDRLVAEHPYYVPSVIHMKHYPSALNEGDVRTFGVTATLLTSAKVPEDLVYAVAKEVFENLEEFKKMHEAYEDLTRESMLTGLTAPLHPGALRYYREAGLK